MQWLRVWACPVLTRVLIGKGLSLIINQAHISALFSLADVVPMSDNSLACLAHTIKVRSIIYACTCFAMPSRAS